MSKTKKRSSATEAVRIGSLLLVLLAGTVTVAHAQQTPCASGEPPVGYLGFAIACDCTVRHDRSPDRPWEFRSDIQVTRVQPGGPADGILAPGDTVLAIDGKRVTTRAGAIRLAQVAPGETVTLTLRRDGTDRRVPVEAGKLCPYDPRVIGSYAPPVRVEAPQSSPDAPTATAPGQGDTSAGPVPVMPDLLPPGRLGLAFACRRCGWEREEGDSNPRWHSATPPIVYAVEPDGAAEAAGIRAGDVLVEVEGASITSGIAGARLGAAQPGEPLELKFRREDKTYVTNLVPASPDRPALLRPRYAGSIGDVEVEVASELPAHVAVSEEEGVMVIRVGETVIRLTARQ